MSSPEEKSANPGYAAGQLERALQTLRSHPDPTVRTRAADKARRFEQILRGMAAGILHVGSRAPVVGAPPWVTLEVAHGGFATGSFLAGGAEQPHEGELRARLGVQDGNRTALNQCHLSDEGLSALRAALESGRFRVQVPEEGALLVLAWLLERGEDAAAFELLDTLAPFFDSLRFYPVPAAAPLPTTAVARLRSVAEVRASLQAVRTPLHVARMNEQLRHFTPLYDRAVALFLETVSGEPPRVRCAADGTPERRPGGAYQLDGGWPCQVYPPGWTARAEALLAEYAATRRQHHLCGKPEDPKENFALLRSFLMQCIKDPRTLTGRDVGMVRKILATFAHRHGAPGSQRHEARRAVQARIAALPERPQIARVLAERLAPYPAEGGVPDVEALSAPLDAAEARTLGVTAPRGVPVSLTKKVLRCLEAPIAELTERGIIPSAEVLAVVIPQISAQVRAARFQDPRLRALYGATYAAFRRRRSLLLLNLQHQVRFEELPWIAALRPFQLGAEPDRGTGKGRNGNKESADPRAAETLREVAALALAAFPERIVPNKLLSEIIALAKDAGLDLALTEELAADIFMDAFGLKFVRAAQVAAGLLDGTAYARYYALPCAQVRRLNDVGVQWGAKVSPGFFSLCEERSEKKTAQRASPVARNGSVIEQSQVLTTHNLAMLWQGLDLGPRLRDQAPELARRCFRYACRRLRARALKRHAQLLALKDAAYAFRQMLFFLSVGGPAAEAEGLALIEAEHAAQDAGFRARFAPAMAGLRRVLSGGELPQAGHELHDGARRLLGWTVGSHWLLTLA